MGGPSSPAQVPSSGDGDRRQRAPDGRPYSIQPGDKVKPVPTRDGDWKALETQIGLWSGLGVMSSVLGVAKTIASKTPSPFLILTATCVLGFVMAFRTWRWLRQWHGKPRSHLLERWLLGRFRKRY
jgi:hypothetical protein